MNVIKHFKNLPGKIKTQITAVFLLACMVATFVAPAASNTGYTVLKEPEIVSSAAIEDTELSLVVATAFAEARKVMNATDNDAKDIFVNNTYKVVGSKWANIGLLIGYRDFLSGTAYGTNGSPSSLSQSEVDSYGNSTLSLSFKKYKAFGTAISNLNKTGLSSKGAAVSTEDGLDSMSSAAIKLGSFGVEFLKAYNPGPVLVALYDYNSAVNNYVPGNKLLTILTDNSDSDSAIFKVTNNILYGLGTPVIAGIDLSLFIVLNMVFAIVCFALSMLLVLFSNRTIADNVKKLLVRVIVGSVGIYIISNALSIGLNWVSDATYSLESDSDSRYVEENLNFQDWYATGFSLPTGTRLTIDSSGQFVLSRSDVRAINEYTYTRLTGNGADDTAIRERMEAATAVSNSTTATFITPTYVAASAGEDENNGEAWATDKLYAIMKNYSENNEDLLDDGGDSSNPLASYSGTSVKLACRYLYMSSLTMAASGSGWEVYQITSDSNYYGLNPISALNVLRTTYTSDTIQYSGTVSPSMAIVAFNANTTYTTSGSTNMNSLIRFIACFTLTLAALKGLITIFVAGFGGLISGGAKTMTGSSYGLFQALGGVVALLLGVLGISILMSMTLALLDAFYGVALELVGDSDVIEGFLAPVQDAVGGIPVLGTFLVNLCSGITSMILTLILSLTFPKLGGIPITIFAQFCSDLPASIGEKGAMLESQLFGGRMGGGGGGGGRGGRYGQMAGQMAGQAFTSSTKQVAAMGAAAAAGVGSLAGGLLTKAGQSLNAKGDKVDGKPSKPDGISDEKWDEMTPEQQKAAEATAEKYGDDWKNMNDEARAEAFDKDGVFGSSETDSDSDDEKQTDDEKEEITDGSLDNNGPEITSEDVSDKHIEAGDEAEGEAGDEVEGKVGDTAGSTDTGEIQDVKTESSLGEGDASTAEAAAAAAAENAESITSGESDGGTTVNEGDTVQQQENVEQHNKLDNNNRQENKVNAKTNVSDSQSIDARTNELGTKGTQDAGKPGTSGAPGAAGLGSTGTTSATAGAGAAGAGAAGVSGSVSKNGGTTATGGGISSTGHSSGSQAQSGAQTQSGPVSYNSSVSQSTQQGGNVSAHTVQQGGNSTTQNASQGGSSVSSTVQHDGNTMTQNTQGGNSMTQNVAATANRNSNVNVGGGQTNMTSHTNNMATAAGNGLTQGTTQKQATKAADGGKSNMSANNQTAPHNYNQTANRYGKTMTTKEQKQSRFLHAAGDALQMAGGNRTMGEATMEALGHAKDATMIYATPIEIQDATGMQNHIREKRIERDRARRMSMGQSAKKK